jgi:3-methylcrotonyl-CoA carboxylase alpha subunit
MMFERILIANRGEIACRIAATARRMGIETIAVFSEADREAAHVAACDQAVPIGPAPARESYLNGARLIEVARDRGAQAIHPGYGFLSENEAFATAVIEAGMVFIGPPPSAIAAMGNKSAAKSLMARAGVPLVPGYHGERQEAEYLHAQADSIGYPVLIKASAGGGGKGMRIVTAREHFSDALASCQREARSAFGDDRVLIERYVQRPRHIEIQVFADRHGQAVHLFERDCSIQRRHQKVIEEAPAPGMDAHRRAAMGEAALAAARAVAYEGAGTVEFIVEPDGRFYFMEMNTRLQVEHPVTEMITGQDLVEWQLRVAAGEPLPCSQESLAIDGHAIEVRLYAEQPERDFLPSIGRIDHLRLPQASRFAIWGSEGAPRAAIRIDSGIRALDSITPHYDPMIAKLITWGADRQQAIARMRAALAEVELVGLACNAGLLSRLMRCAPFVAGDLDTGLIERERAQLLPTHAQRADGSIRALAAALWMQRAAAPGAQRPQTDWTDPWSIQTAWRVSGPASQAVTLESEGQAARFSVEFMPDGEMSVSEEGHITRIESLSRAASGSVVSAQIDGVPRRFSVHERADALYLFDRGTHYRFVERPLGRSASERAGVPSGACALTAPMPGKVVSLPVALGDTVDSGQILMVLEAMKMEHQIRAPQAGRIGTLSVREGDQVDEGTVLLVIGPDVPPSTEVTVAPH